MTIRVLSFDVDGCLFNLSYLCSDNKDVVLHNEVLLNGIKATNKAFDRVITFVGSNRQSKETDNANIKLPYKGSCFPAIQHISTHLNAELDTFLLADIYENLPDGTSFARALNHEFTGEHADWCFDETKATIIYAQMHKIAKANPKETITFDFYDDRDDILVALKTFFEKYNELIPVNVTLRLQSYAGEEVGEPVQISGAGNIDTHYRHTVKHMAAIARKGAAIPPDDMLCNIRIRTESHVTPELLLAPKNLDAQLLIIETKAQQLLGDGYGTAAKKALDLCDVIHLNVDKYLNGEITGQVFRGICTTAMGTARTELEQHRGWKQWLGNLGLAIAGLGIGYVVAGLVNMAMTGNFLLFRPKTDSVKKLDDLQSKIDPIVLEATQAAPAA